jgi:hypothetical protein
MKPDWDALSEEFASSSKVVVADVDCTTTGKSLCEKYGVRGYPTIKYFNPPDEAGEDYKGGRDLAALKKFTSELGPGCSVDALENCSAEQKAELDKYVAMPADERDSKLTEMKEAIDKAEKDHEELLKQLQSTYKESMEKLEKLKEDSAPTMKLLKAATPKPKTGGKDEV